MELVKITYRFADGHVEELEVEQDVADALKELDRQEYNNTQKERRRHVLLSGMEYEGENLVDLRMDTERIVIGKIGAAKFRAAFRKLKPRQQELLFSLYLSDRPISQAEYPLCEQCKSEGRLTAAEEVHHILPLANGGTNDEGNLMALCKSCHSSITIETENKKSR